MLPNAGKARSRRDAAGIERQFQTLSRLAKQTLGETGNKLLRRFDGRATESTRSLQQ
jgi:hypothetical protein